MTDQSAEALALKAAQATMERMPSPFAETIVPQVATIIQRIIEPALVAAREERDRIEGALATSQQVVATLRDERDEWKEMENERTTELQSACADLEAAEQREAALKAEVEALKTRVANDSLAIERLEGKWCAEVVDTCQHDEKAWVCCSDCHATAVLSNAALRAQVERMRGLTEGIVGAYPQRKIMLPWVQKLRAALADAPPAEKEPRCKVHRRMALPCEVCTRPGPCRPRSTATDVCDIHNRYFWQGCTPAEPPAPKEGK